MSLSNFLENELLDHVFGNGAYTAPATLYISLHTGDPGETGANETTGTSYARLAVTNNATNWPAASSGAKANGTVFTFATPGSGGWGTVTHFGIWDASTSGNFLGGSSLAASRTINEADTVSFAVGELDINLSNSTFLANELLDHVFGNAAYTAPATLYFSLHTGAPSTTGANEATGTDYARASITNNATNFPAASGGVKSNDTAINFATPGSGGWGTASHFGIWDASTSGNFLGGGALSVSKAIDAGDTVSFAGSAVTITLD